MWTTASTDPALRTELLTRAIELSTALGSVFDEIGSTRFIKSSTNDHGTDNLLRPMYVLEDKLHRTMQSVNERRNYALSPTSRLPDDILQSIFSLLPFELQLIAQRKPWGSNSILVSHVCRRWRALAVDTAQIWSRIVLRPPVRAYGDAWHPYYHDTRTQDSRLQDFLEIKSWTDSADKASVFLSRSKSSGLDLDARLLGRRGFEAYLETGRDIHQTLASLQYLSRTTVLRVHADSHSSLRTIISHLPAAVLTLRKLYIIFTPSRPPSTSPPEVQSSVDQFFATDMPLLDEVTLDCIPLPTQFTALRVCRSLVLHIQRDEFVLERLHSLMQSCVQLKRWDVTLPGQFDAVSLTGKRVQMSHLEALTVRSNANFFYTGLEAPRLHTLHVELDSTSTLPQSRAYSTNVCGLLNSSFASLQSLTLAGLFPDAWKEILTITSSITKLTFRPRTSPFRAPDPGDVFELINALTPKEMDRHDRLCPNLENLYIVIKVSPLLLQDLVRCAVSRKAVGLAPAKPLHRIVLQGWVREGMPELPEDAYSEEAKLATEVEELVIGNWIFDRLARRWKKDTMPKYGTKDSLWSESLLWG